MMLPALLFLLFLPLASAVLAQPAAVDAARTQASWVLLVPARIMPHGVEVWNLDDPWSMVWRRERMPGPVAIGAAAGDDEDLDLLSQAQAQARDRDALRRLARKYGAQGTALAVIDEAGAFAADPNASAGNDVQIETLYVPVDGPPAHVMVGLTRLADSGVRDIARQLAGVIGKLAADSAAGVVMGQPPQFLTPPPRPGEAAALWRSQGAFAPPSVAVGGGVGAAGSAVWRGVDGQSAHFIRLRARNAGEWQRLAGALASIPGAKFTPVASAQGWLQGYIGYNGSVDALRRELIQRNIPTE